MSKKTPSPEMYMIGLVPDADGNFAAPNFRKSAQELVAFIQGRGEFLGILDGQQLNYALVNIIDHSLVEGLHQQSFVARVAGLDKDIGPLRKVSFHPVDEEKIGAELTI
ncbi:MAG: hypothetical protein KA155_03100 [Alphaproteobacteria bacterium]|nr:hypothetical protein [Alphaproteobacteria bacterium]